MRPEQLAKTSEHSHQVAFFAWCALSKRVYPELELMFAVPNGGQRGDGTAKGRAIAGGKMKAEGVRAGIPDTMLPVQRGSWNGLFIEFKKPGTRNHKNGGRSEAQDEMFPKLRAQGYCVLMAYSWDEAKDHVLAYLNSGQRA